MANESARVLHLCPSTSGGSKAQTHELTLDRLDEVFLDMCRKAAHDIRCQRFIDLGSVRQTVAQLSSVGPVERFSDIDDASSEFLGSLASLLRLLQFGFARVPRLYYRGSTDLSFDEAWLIYLLKAHRHDDADSCSFLLASRLKGANGLLVRKPCLDLLTHIQICLGHVERSVSMKEIGRESASHRLEPHCTECDR